MLISRSDRGALARWWFTVDKLLLTSFFLVMAAGLIVNLAASPPVAARLGLDPFHFFQRQLTYLVPAALLMVLASFLDERLARWTSLGILIVGILLMALALVTGPEVKGAHRWVQIGPLNLQPSEFVKPAFVIIAAWLLAESARLPDMPGFLMASLLFMLIVGLLVLQPDLGQAALVSLVFALMLLTYGISWKMVLGLASLGVAGVAIAYRAFPHVASRIDRFLSPDKGDTFQTDTAMQAFGNGGLFGTGPGAGEAKQILPDAHADFIFSVLGEEFGFVAGAVLVGLFCFIVLRVLLRALEEPGSFGALALTGLVAIFGLQAIINMGVNLSLLPAKGMTLPFISYGGSSLLSMAYAMGLVLALGRRRPRTELQVIART
jgi:cell division protein FtsW